jgi:hypothetical protein
MICIQAHFGGPKIWKCWYILCPFWIFYRHLVILWPFGTFCVHLVHFSGFGIMHHEKSGNPGSDTNLNLVDSVFSNLDFAFARWRAVRSKTICKCMQRHLGFPPEYFLPNSRGCTFWHKNGPQINCWVKIKKKIICWYFLNIF